MDTLISAIKPINFTKGDAIITQGEDGDFQQIIRCGTAHCFVKKGDEEAPGTKVMEYRDGMAFGELALMQGCPRAATIIAQTEMECYGIDSTSFKVIMLRTAIKRKDQMIGIIKSCKILADNLDTNEISVLGDSIDVIE